MSSESILVLDDDENITRLTRSVLSMSGYEVTESNNPVDAITLVEQESFDLILADIMMPEMDGVEFIRRAKRSKANANTRYAILSAKKLKLEDRREIFDLGVEIMSKPFMPNQLVDMIGEILAKEPPQAPAQPTDILTEHVAILRQAMGHGSEVDRSRLNRTAVIIAATLAGSPDRLDSNTDQIIKALRKDGLHQSPTLRAAFVAAVRALKSQTRETILKSISKYRRDPKTVLHSFGDKIGTDDEKTRKLYAYYLVYVVIGGTLQKPGEDA